MTESFQDFPAVYRRFLAPMRARCRRLLGQSAQAEDVVQEVFLRLWRVGPRVEDQTDARTVMAWLYRTSTRLVIDILRQRRHFESTDIEAPMPCAASHESTIAARQLIAALVEHVSDDELEAAMLCRIDGLAQPEAATVLGVSERTVRRLLERFDMRTERWRKEHTS